MSSPVVRVYPDLTFPATPPERPYVLINMVTTLDGKIVSGERDEPVSDLGSDVDHATMRDIEAAADAVMIGAGTLRATPRIRYGPSLRRVVVTASGRVDPTSRFFTEAPGRAVVLTTSTTVLPRLSEEVQVWREEEPFDWHRVLARLRESGVMRLLCEGGSDLNAQLFTADVVDEVFLTIAPKVKLGSLTPTVAGGEPLPRESLRRYALLSCVPVGDEVFLRYRRT